MLPPFIAKLRHGADLTEADESVLATGVKAVDHFAAGQDIVSDGDRPTRVRLVVEGLACRYKVLSDGSRSIMAFLLPGDMCDLHVSILGEMDHAIGALTACRVAGIPKVTIEAWTEQHPRINRALRWANLVDEAVLRAWLANVGARRGPARVAHLFCEIGARMQSVGLATAGDFPFPLTQTQLGQATGLSKVHTNRVLKELGSEGVALKRGRVTIPDLPRLKDMAGFDPQYLHLSGSSKAGPPPQRGKEPTLVED